ncbi:hypothetical protein [Nocardioides sp. B-3]|uniref:hypothetical protein n=1 Tax=Nocardioides sp. B-3 TaxID=2895565 RepID=UPI002152908D|nr:hypothetical protein [Nocardioides sp. B-3]UUZ58868.1 hypothetical protein LP418_22810 [Nocardioides sp. B-3]
MMVRERQPDKAPDWPEMMAWRPDDFPTELPAEFDGRGGRARFMRASGVIRGYYGGQVRHGLSVFPREQWLFLDFATLLAEPNPTLDKVTRHIGVGRFKPYPPLRQLMAGSPSISGTAPTGADLMTLARPLEPELAEYVALTGLSVDHWTTERLLTGDLDAAEQATVYARKAGLA